MRRHRTICWVCVSHSKVSNNVSDCDFLNILFILCRYSVRFESVLPRPYASIMFCTVGVLLRRMEGGLRGVSHVLIDEIHERDVGTDFMLVLLRDMLHVNPDLRVILMSATIDTSLFRNYFGNCPILESIYLLLFESSSSLTTRHYSLPLHSSRLNFRPFF